MYQSDNRHPVGRQTLVHNALPAAALQQLLAATMVSHPT
jgi:hypothetical protein